MRKKNKLQSIWWIILKKNILVDQLRIREVIKKFVDWCDELYIYLLSYAYNFYRENNATNVLFVVKIQVKYVDK